MDVGVTRHARRLGCALLSAGQKRKRLLLISTLTMAGLAAGGVGATLAATRGVGEPGPAGPGKWLLINQRTITPAGQQSTLGDLPVNAVLSPDGAHLLVVNSGAGIQSLQVVTTATGQDTKH